MPELTPAQKRQSEDMSVNFPPKDIVCKGCAFAKPGVLGYRNSYCEMYPRGKPDKILFNHGDCEMKQVY